MGKTGRKIDGSLSAQARYAAGTREILESYSLRSRSAPNI
jgi:hypothetical protein